mmetsp:Transcript_5487/g.20560  ORF Transcript_5487/g.20560 Transcript_5487/m.20560 type:complete len:86 (-) Transcript_5487:279-536(-)
MIIRLIPGKKSHHVHMMQEVQDSDLICYCGFEVFGNAFYGIEGDRFLVAGFVDNGVLASTDGIFVELVIIHLDKSTARKKHTGEI